MIDPRHTFWELFVLFNVVFVGGLRGRCRMLIFLCLLLPLRLVAGVDEGEGNANGIKVLASIKPLQLIAQAITQSVADTEVLLPAGTTPHDYALKPSDLARVYDADLVLWLGAPYEAYLAKPVAIREADDLAVISFDEPVINKHHEGHDHSGHSHLYGDPHVWLSPVEALSIAQMLAETLLQRDSANAHQYEANLAIFSEQLQIVDERIKASLDERKGIRYLVYHDAYSYFENHYGLTHVLAVAGQPESKPGAKSLLKLRRAIISEEVGCLFSEPRADSDIVSILKEGNAMQVYQLDPMATDIEAGVAGYIMFLEQTAEQFLACN